MRTLILVLLAAISSTAVADDSPIRIGLMAEFSGQYAKNGADCRRGFEAARRSYAPEDRVSGRTVKFLYGDTQRDPKVGLSELRKMLTGDGIDVLVLNSAPVSMALKPVTEHEGLPSIFVSGQKDALQDTSIALRMWDTAGDEAIVLAKAMLGQGLKQPAIISSEDEWIMDFRAAFLAEFAKAGSTPVFDQIVQKSESDFSTLAAKIVSAKPGFVIVNLGLGQAGVFIRRLRELGYSGPLAGTYFAAHPAEIQSAGIEKVEGMKVAQIAQEGAASGAAILADGAGPYTPLTYGCFCGLALVLDTLKAAPAVKGTREALARLLISKPEVSLPNGEILKLKNREAQFPIALKTIRGGVLRME